MKCPECGREISKHGLKAHKGSVRCVVTKQAKKMREKGWVPVGYKLKKHIKDMGVPKKVLPTAPYWYSSGNNFKVHFWTKKEHKEKAKELEEKCIRGIDWKIETQNIEKMCETEKHIKVKVTKYSHLYGRELPISKVYKKYNEGYIRNYKFIVDWKSDKDNNEYLYTLKGERIGEEVDVDELSDEEAVALLL